MLVEGGVRLGEVWIEDGAVYWVEGRPLEGGRSVVVRGDPGAEPTDVTPEGFNARTTVHEYGGGAYLVHRGVVFSSNFADQRDNPPALASPLCRDQRAVELPWPALVTQRSFLAMHRANGDWIALSAVRWPAVCGRTPEREPCASLLYGAGAKLLSV